MGLGTLDGFLVGFGVLVKVNQEKIDKKLATHGGLAKKPGEPSVTGCNEAGEEEKSGLGGGHSAGKICIEPAGGDDTEGGAEDGNGRGEEEGVTEAFDEEQGGGRGSDHKCHHQNAADDLEGSNGRGADHGHEKPVEKDRTDTQGGGEGWVESGDLELFKEGEKDKGVRGEENNHEHKGSGAEIPALKPEAFEGG
jgi:hypothetical protein